VLKFDSSEAAQNFIRKNDKLWLFNPTWQAQVRGPEIWLRHYPPLSESEFKSFTESKDALPSRFCSFEQYYANQMKAAENLFDVGTWTVEVKEG
jgi:hypothetical protein